MSTYHAWQVTGHRQFEWVQRELVDPAAGHVRIRVQTCGVCHSDWVAAEAVMRDPSVPLVPGHEIVGFIDAVGEGVRRHKVGDRVGVGYLGGQCHECEPCRRGVSCTAKTNPSSAPTPTAATPSTCMSAPAELSRSLRGSAMSKPRRCCAQGSPSATLCWPRRHRHVPSSPSKAWADRATSAVQYAKGLGHRTAVIARGAEKAALADKLGADLYIDSTTEDPGRPC